MTNKTLYVHYKDTLQPQTLIGGDFKNVVFCDITREESKYIRQLLLPVVRCNKGKFLYRTEEASK